MKSRRIAGLLAPIAGFLVAALLLYPGQYSFDSAYQLWQARTGAFNDVSPVTMTGLWSLLLRTSANPAALLWVNLALYWTGLGLCVAFAVRSAWVRVVLLGVLGFAPLTLVEMGQLLSDSHFAALLTLATGLAAWGLAARRRGPIVAACAALVYAGCIRHNAPIAILPFGGIAARILLTKQDHAQRWSSVTSVLGWRAASTAALALGLASVVLGAGLDRMFAREHATVWPSLALWDLAAISVARGEMLLPAFTRGPGLTADELVATGAFDPSSNTLLYQKSRSGVRDGLGAPYSATELRALRHAWIASVLRYPGAYLRHRLRTMWLLAGPHRGRVQGAAYFEARVRYRDDPPLPEPFAPGVQRRLYAIAAALVPTWLFAGLPYLVLSLLAIVIAARNVTLGRVALAASASAIVYTLPFVFLAPGAELRYLTWPIVAGPLALLLALASRRHRQGDHRSSHEASRGDSSRPGLSLDDSLRHRSYGRGAVRAFLRIALAGVALHAGAASGASLALVGAAIPEASIVGAAWGWEAPEALRESPATRVTWGFEADVMNVHARRGRSFGAADIAAVGLTPNLRVEWQRGGARPYVELGAGAHLLSHTQLRGGPSLGTAFQFGEWLGAGWRFGAGQAFEIGARIEHLSNAEIKHPNDGLTFGAIRLGWHY